MQTLRQRLSTLLFCSTLLATCAMAQSTLSQVEDTVYTPGGALFSGTVVITWLGSSPTGSSPVPYNTTVTIYNGALSVLLVPSTTATPPADYQAAYNSSDGLVSWIETWQVPPSATPLTLNEVRVANGGGTITGTGSGNGTSIAIAQVTGLSAYLSSLNNSIGSITALIAGLNASIANMASSISNLSTQVNSLASGTTNAVFQDAETPGGAVNGSNTSFTLANTPGFPASLKIFKNGLLQASGIDYTLSGTNVTFTSNSTPKTGDILLAYYRLPGTGPLATFIDDEIPAGTYDGNNLTFTLSETPNPAASVKLFKNGALLQQGADYTLSGSTITFVRQSVTPQPGDSLYAYYRTLNIGLNSSIYLSRGATGLARRDR